MVEHEFTAPLEPGTRSPIPLIVGLTASVVIIATFGQFALGQLGGVFAKELGAPISMIGVCASIMFAAGGVASIPMGWVVDRVAPSVLTPIHVALAGTSFAALAFVQSDAGLMVMCAMIGVVMTMSIPLTNRIIALYVPRSAYARVIGWKSVGPQAGAVLAGAIFGGTLNLVPWRVVVITITLTMFAVSVWTFFALRRRATFGHSTVPERTGNGKETQREPNETHAIVWWLLPYSFFAMGAIASVGVYIPLFATEELHLSSSAGGAAVAVAAGVSVLSRFGWIRFLTPKNAVKVLIVAGLLVMFAAPIMAVSPFYGPWAFWAAVVLVGVTALGSTPISQIVLVQNASLKSIGVISSCSSVSMFAGLTFQPWLISVLIDEIGFRASWLALSFCGLMSALTMVMHVFVQRRRRGAEALHATTQRANDTVIAARAASTEAPTHWWL